MDLLKAFKLAIDSLFHSKLRSILSIIGIIIGVASVIIIVSIGSGLQFYIEDKLSMMGNDLIMLTPGHVKSGQPSTVREMMGGAISPYEPLSDRDIQAIKLLPNIKEIGGAIYDRADIKYLSEKTNVLVQGIEPKVMKVMFPIGLDKGRNLNYGDRNVAFLGYNVAYKLFDKKIQLNRQIYLNKKPFRVIGVMEEIGMGTDDDQIYIPLESARDLFPDIDEKEFSYILIKAKDADIVEDTVNLIEKKLRATRGVNKNTQDFTVSSSQALQEMVSGILLALTLFLGAIAAISLLVGSVGIANTMFTSVLEKTKDIGIMKAVGAKNRDILTIFLLNSGLIGLVGGITGMLIGVGISQGLIPLILSKFTNLEIRPVVTVWLVLFVLIFSFLIGVISGIIPAYRASKKNPVDALRYE